MTSGWVLIVFKIPRRHRLVRELELKPSRKPGQWFRRYDAGQEKLVREHVELLRAANFHGTARKIKPAPAPRLSENIIPFRTAQRARIRHERRRQAALAAKSDDHVQSVLKRARGDP
jgi:hypothetical protein